MYAWANSQAPGQMAGLCCTLPQEQRTRNWAHPSFRGSEWVRGPSWRCNHGRDHITAQVPSGARRFVLYPANLHFNQRKGRKRSISFPQYQKVIKITNWSLIPGENSPVIAVRLEQGAPGRRTQASLSGYELVPVAFRQRKMAVAWIFFFFLRDRLPV